MFAHAATSGVWDDSPTNADYERIYAEKTASLGAGGTLGRDFGISFENGTLFDLLRKNNVPFLIYTGDGYPQVGLLAGGIRS